jgi:hypothetical protein
LYSASTGMKAWLNAPSAKSLLKTLGIFIMTTKASKATPAPNKPVRTMSLTRPRILETKVQKLTKPLLSNSLKDLKLFSDFEFSLQPHHLVLSQEKLNLYNTLIL